MPLVEVKVFEDELTQEQTTQLIQRITDAVTTVTSEKLRDVTWVIVNTVKSGSWVLEGTPWESRTSERSFVAAEEGRCVHRARDVELQLVR
jgi:4-oxalocrotonate tautomerase